MNDPQPFTPLDAQAALDSMADARRQVAELGDCPPWRHAAFGAVMALLVGGIGLPGPVQQATMLAGLAGMIAVAASDRRRTGAFVNGYRPGATRPFTFGLLAAVLGLVVVQLWLKRSGAPDAAHLAVGLAAFAICTCASVIWSRIFRREMEAAL